MIIAECE